MTSGPIVNVVRSVGALTEPFIRQRVAVELPGSPSQLWFERSIGVPPPHATHIRHQLLGPGTAADRIYHRLPQIGPRLAGAYREAERRTRPRFIHAHFATTGYLVGMVTDSPLIVSVYGFDISVMAQRRLWRHAYRRLASRAAAVLVEGPFMQRAVIELGFQPQTVHIVRIGAGLQNVRYNDPLPATDRPVQLLTCGRLVEKKGHSLAIAAFAALRPVLPVGSRLEVIGDGPLARELTTLSQRLGVADGVTFRGAVPRDMFHERLRASDLFLAPSVTASNGDSEGGAPTTILDAQAVGTIIVASSHADIPFLVDDGRTGFLVEEGNANALSEGIRRALASRCEWPAIAVNAARQVAELHSDHAVAAELLRIYGKVR